MQDLPAQNSYLFVPFLIVAKLMLNKNTFSPPSLRQKGSEIVKFVVNLIASPCTRSYVWKEKVWPRSCRKHSVACITTVFSNNSANRKDSFSYLFPPRGEFLLLIVHQPNREKWEKYSSINLFGMCFESNSQLGALFWFYDHQ